MRTIQEEGAALRRLVARVGLWDERIQTRTYPSQAEWAEAATRAADVIDAEHVHSWRVELSGPVGEDMETRCEECGARHPDDLRRFDG